MNIDNLLDLDWKNELKEIFNSNYVVKLIKYIEKEYENKIIFPKKDDIFKAFNICKYDNLKVVIIGQDPYFNPNQANGLAFSVNKNIPLPPSLKNIYKEIENEFNLKFTDKDNGDLTYLANQGVLLLNSILTVECDKPLSHKKIIDDENNILSWEYITNQIISKISSLKKNIVYLLWGNYAKNKIKYIDTNDNLILTSGHPSPLSARFFFGNNHFIKTNEYLLKNNKEPIKWII